MFDVNALIFLQYENFRKNAFSELSFQQIKCDTYNDVNFSTDSMNDDCIFQPKNHM